ncbi:MAG TPA: iron-sulfur cluster assembly protein [Candidatus Margulisiibacteriota bacterium]|nr:iron-sulfur cluster assembly protein [Candidatus Margulisiibacteriota bacterium]
MRQRYEEVDFTRDCDVVQVPQGHIVRVEAGTTAVITQALGDSYTIEVPTLGGLYRLGAGDADAIGKEPPLAASEADAGPLDEARVLRALKNVYDPEIPVNVVDLGLIYELQIHPLAAGGSTVDVQMSLTAPGCGMGRIIADDVKSRIEALPGVADARVEVVWEPPWSPQRISPAGRTKLGLE